MDTLVNPLWARIGVMSVGSPITAAAAFGSPRAAR